MLKCLCSVFCKGSVFWLTQRISAILMIGYFLPIISIWLCSPDKGYMWWSHYLTSDLMLALLLLNLLMFFLHAAIGIWTVVTDYISNSALRNLLLIATFAYMAGLLGLSVVTIII